MNLIYVLITGSYILLVATSVHITKKYGYPDWWTGVALAIYTAVIVLVLKNP